MSWRVEAFIDGDGHTYAAHVLPDVDDADGWDGLADGRSLRMVHWHQRSTDGSRAFHEIPDDVARRVVEAADGAGELSFHEALMVLLIRHTL